MRIELRTLLWTRRVIAARVATLAIAGVAVFAASSLMLKTVVFAQAHPAADRRQPTTRDQIVAHLNAVIQFYRSSTEPIQKAGEPNDVVYRDQAKTLAGQVAAYAFQSAKAQAALMAESRGESPTEDDDGDGTQEQRIQASIHTNEQQIQDLKLRESALNAQIDKANARQLGPLEAEKKQLEGSLELATAIREALQKIVSITGATGSTGLEADVDRLRSSVPELDNNNKVASSLLVTIDSAQSSGVTTQGSVLIDLLTTRRSLDNLLHENTRLQAQATNLRMPLLTVLRGLVQQGQQISQQEIAAVPAPAAKVETHSKGKKPVAKAAPAASSNPNGTAPAAPPPPDIDAITAQFKALSATTVPLSQEIIILEQSRANLLAWEASVDQEYDSILHTLVLRLTVIIVALVLIFGGGEVWRHAASKYVADIRRRRQLLIVRRVVVGFLSAIVILFGFVTQFNSLATFAGFITAGIAVGLQTILLSVAAYFFIIGRYGIKVGDRITIATVTGDVIDVGLVRFYMMELAGLGTELNPTGRVAVFSNAVLFQAGIPLYKQIPGTEYAWRELVVKLADNANYKLIADAVMHEVSAAYETHRVQIEAQHRSVEQKMQIPINVPCVESRVQFSGGSFQLWARFPVMISKAAEMEEQLTQALATLLANNPEVKSGVAATPIIQASVKG